MPKNTVLVNLVDFLRTGVFGPVRFGISRQELWNIIGETECYAFARRKDRLPSIYRYGAVEFSFISPDDDRLLGVHMDTLTDLSGDKQLQLEPSWIRDGLSQSEVEQYLREAGIEWKEDRKWEEAGQIDFQLSSGVKLIIDAEMGLRAVSHFFPLETKVTEKQVGLYLPIEVYDKVREEALSQKTSISKLCSMWIIEHASALPRDE